MKAHFLHQARVLKVANAQSAGTGDVATSIVDMQGFDSICFLAALADVTVNAVVGIKAQQDDANGTGGMADLTGSAVTFTASATSADNKIVATDVCKPMKRYVRAVVTRATANVAVDAVLAVLYNAKDIPPGLGSDVIAAAFTVEPSE